MGYLIVEMKMIKGIFTYEDLEAEAKRAMMAQ